MPRGEEMGLDERISALFAERFDRLDRLQNAKEVTQADLDFLEETESLVADCDRRNTGELAEGAAGILESLRAVLAAANGAVDRATLVEATEAGERKKRGKKKERAEEAAEEYAYEPEAPAVVELTEANFAGDEEAMAWFVEVRRLEELVDAAEAADPAARESFFDGAEQAYTTFITEEYDRNLAFIEDAGNTLSDYPFLQVVGARLDRIADRLEAHFGARAPEVSAAPEVDREAIWNRYNDEILEMNGQINTLLDMPLTTQEDVEAARETFDVILANMKDYADDWRKEVSPILDDMKRRQVRWGSWGPLSKEHSALVLRFFGRKPKNEGDEAIEGVLQRFGRELRDRSRAFRQEKWEKEFPDFAVFSAKIIVHIQDARMRRGEDRVQALEGIQTSFASMEEEWKTLRTGGPRRPSLQEHVRGVRSPVNQYDVLLRQLGKDIPMLVKSAPKARPARLDDVAFLWREALVMTGQFWNSGVGFREKIAFLRRYGSGETNDEEMTKMVRADQRENFEAVAESDVLTDLRARGVQKRERRERTERRERARLYHPKLEMLRMEAKEMYRSAINARFWKDEVTDATREQLFAADAKIEDDELKELVNDVPAYRRMYGMVNSAYKRVAEVEDPLYLEGKQPEGKIKAKQFRRIIDRYLEAEQREVAAWKGAKYASGWEGRNKSYPERERTLHIEFNQFWNIGERAFGDIPMNLRKPIVTWVMARQRLRVFETYTQWLIDENPTLAQSVENMPRVFAVPEKEVSEDDADDVTDETTISDEERAELVLPVQEVRTGDEVGGGAFEDIEVGAAADTGVRGGEAEEEGDEAAESPAAATPEGGSEARDEALDAEGRRIVRELTE